MILEPQCSKRSCVHFLGVKMLEEGNEATEVPYCTAFPNGIPQDIGYGSNKHTEPYPGDNGILYQKDH